MKKESGTIMTQHEIQQTFMLYFIVILAITAFVSLMLHISLLLSSCPVCVLPLVALQTHENGLSATNL